MESGNVQAGRGGASFHAGRGAFRLAGLVLLACGLASVVRAAAFPIRTTSTTVILAPEMPAPEQPFTVRVAPVRETPKIDGRLSEACWQQIPPLSGFLELATGKPAAPRTLVRVGSARRWLYVAAACETEDVRAVDAFRQERDSDVFHDDSIELLLDPREYHGRVYRFVINSRGTRFDEIIPFGGRGTGDARPVWLGRARPEIKTRWTAELAIDLASLDLSSRNPGNWRANFIRHARGALRNDSAWVPARFWNFGCDRERMGTLMGIDGRGLLGGCRLRVTGGDFLPTGAQARGTLAVEVSNDSLASRSYEVVLRTTARWLDTRPVSVDKGSAATVEFPVALSLGEEHEFKIEAVDPQSRLPAAAIAYVFRIPPALHTWFDRSYYANETSAVLHGEIGRADPDRQSLESRLYNAETNVLVWKGTPAVNQGGDGHPSGFAVPVPLRTLLLGGYLMETVLEDSTLKQRFRVWSPMRRLGPVQGGLQVDARGGFLLREGKPFYPVEIRRVEHPTDAMLDEIRSKGTFNVNWASDLSDRETDAYIQRFGKATGCLGDLNVDRLAYTTGPVRDDYIARLRQLAARPALFAYGMDSLPGEDGYSTEPMATVRSYLQSLDPHHPLYVVLGHPSQAERYRDCADFLAVRCRGTGTGGSAEPEWVYQQVRAAKENAGPTVPVVALLEVLADPRRGVELPTPAQLRAMTYLALVGGAVGVAFDGYQYRDEKDTLKRGFSDDPALRETVYILSRHVALLGPVALSPEAAGAVRVEHNGTIRWMARRYAGGVRIIAVNCAPQPAAAAFQLLEPTTVGSVLELLENRQIVLDNSRFSVQFGPYETHVFAIK